MPNGVNGYKLTMNVNVEKCGIKYLRDLILALNEHFAVVKTIDVDGEEVFNTEKGGFYTKQ